MSKVNGPDNAANLCTKHLSGHQMADESAMCKLHYMPGRHSSALKLTVDTEVINRDYPLLVCLLDLDVGGVIAADKRFDDLC